MRPIFVRKRCLIKQRARRRSRKRLAWRLAKTRARFRMLRIGRLAKKLEVAKHEAARDPAFMALLLGEEALRDHDELANEIAATRMNDVPF